jgi:hypothetical protein
MPAVMLTHTALCPRPDEGNFVVRRRCKKPANGGYGNAFRLTRGGNITR